MFSLKSLPDKLEDPIKPDFLKWLVTSIGVFVFIVFTAKLFLIEQYFLKAVYFTFFLAILLCLVLFVVMRIYEGKKSYVKEWNNTIDQERDKIITWGSKSFAVLDYSYVSSIANNKIFFALNSGKNTIAPIYIPRLGEPKNMAWMEPFPQRADIREYQERLGIYIKRFSYSFKRKLLKDISANNVILRIKHDNVLGDDEVSTMFFNAFKEDDEFIKGLVFDNDAGANFSWLNSYLDEDVDAIVSLEINLMHEEFPNYSGEAVSIILFVKPDLAKQVDLPILGLVHRSFNLNSDFFSEDLISYSKLESNDIFAIKHLAKNKIEDKEVKMFKALQPLMVDEQIDISLIMGDLGNSTFNILVIAACDSFKEEPSPKLLVGGNETISFFVVNSK